MIDSTEEKHSHIRIRILTLVSVVSISCTLTLYSYLYTPPQPLLRVVFFDVGQGDAIYIESPTGTQVLVDAGRDKSVLRRLSREMHFFDRSIDMVIMTHEDSDHAGGMAEVFRRYDVGTFLRTENQGESFAADAVDEAMEIENAKIVYARAGMEFDLGGGAMLRVLFPDRDPAMLESNTSSIIARLTYGETEFLFTGDSPKEIEEYLLDRGLIEKSDVLKLGHHGSRTSTSADFLNAVKPAYAIVSAGKDNPYGHPHSEVIDLLNKKNISVLSTANEGSIVFESDGGTLLRKDRRMW